tara:strand:- start:955 stop:1674 length:720 start_codon:yes stop_codon:yes gene_type:complete
MSLLKNISFFSKKNINIYSKWKSKLSLIMLSMVPINIINKYPVKSYPISEQVAFCENHASSNIPFNDPDYLKSYDIVYNYCMKEVKKQIIKLSYEKERGELSPIQRKEMKNKLLNISSKKKSKCTETKQELSPGFFVCDLVMGKGRTASESDYVFVEYIGKNLNGIEFDTSYGRPSFFPFTIGEGRVIKGWDQGVKNMKEGGVRQLIIPPELAYGSQRKGKKIPPNSTLIFIVHLLKVN